MIAYKHALRQYIANSYRGSPMEIDAASVGHSVTAPVGSTAPHEVDHVFPGVSDHQKTDDGRVTVDDLPVVDAAVVTAVDPPGDEVNVLSPEEMNVSFHRWGSEPSSDDKIEDSQSYEAEAQMVFNLYVLEHTTLVDLTRVELQADLVFPQCPCENHLPCALRSHNDPQYEGACLWVCATGTCMTWQDADVAIEHGQEVPNLIGTEPETVSQCAGPSQESHEENQEMFTQLRGWIEEGNDAQIANLVADLVIDLDSEVERTITHNLTVPQCNCEKLAKAVIDKVTGGIFFVCRDGTCWYVEQCEEEALIG
jgi:hypothetical protein